MASANPPSARPPATGSAPTAPDDQASRWPVRAQGANSEQMETHLNRAQAQIHLQRWADALASLEAVIALLPNHAKALEMRQQVLHRLGRNG